jgi:hypothetical protein
MTAVNEVLALFAGLQAIAGDHAAVHPWTFFSSTTEFTSQQMEYADGTALSQLCSTMGTHSAAAVPVLLSQILLVLVSKGGWNRHSPSYISRYP